MLLHGGRLLHCGPRERFHAMPATACCDGAIERDLFFSYRGSRVIDFDVFAPFFELLSGFN